MAGEEGRQVSAVRLVPVSLHLGGWIMRERLPVCGRCRSGTLPNSAAVDSHVPPLSQGEEIRFLCSHGSRWSVSLIESGQNKMTNAKVSGGNEGKSMSPFQGFGF
jgi:hypothetical protein